MSRSPVRTLAVCALTVLVVGSCSVPDDESVRIIDRSKMEFDLAEPSTTTAITTTTTPAPTTATTTATVTSTPTVTTGPAGTATVTIAPTTTVPVEPVRLYFVEGDNLVEVMRTPSTELTNEQVLGLLEYGPFSVEAALGMRSALERGDVLSASLRGGILNVDVSRKFRDLPASEQRRAIAQLVLTFTSRAGVGPVRFTSQGRTYEVPRADGTIGTATVSRDDYVVLVVVPTTTTLPPESTTTTSVPPSSAPTTRARRRRAG